MRDRAVSASDAIDADLTFGEAHALYTPPRGTGMTLRQAEAFLDRYAWFLLQESYRVTDWLATQTTRQGVWDRYEPNASRLASVVISDAVTLARHANRAPAVDWVGAGHVHYRMHGGEPCDVVLCVAWETERVVSRWFGPIHPPDWGIDETDHGRWRV